MKKSEGKFINALFATVSFLMPICVTPWRSFDPINVPRQVLLVSVACSMLPLILVKEKINIDSWFKIKSLKSIRFWTFVFVASLLSSYFFSGSSLLPQLIGADGRNNGLITQFSFLILFVSAIKFREILRVRYILFGLLFGAIINVIYGTAQAFGKDFIPWNNAYGPVVGTLGNPNFMSSFMGLSAVCAITFISFRGKYALSKSIALVLIILSCLWIIAKTNSIQGFAVFCFGFVSSVFLATGTYRSKIRFSLFSLITGPILILSALGLLGRGPLSQFLYQSTLQVRFEFWDAAVRMILAKPLTGIGLDSFGDWYRYYRSPESIQLYGTGLLTNSAHNVFLDYGAFGGFPLLTSFLALQVIVLTKAINYIRHSEKLSKEYLAVFSIWISFHLQNLIAVNSISIATFGWLSGGILYGLSGVRVETKSVRVTLSKSSRRDHLYLSLIALLGGIALMIPNFINDSNFRKAISINEGSQLIATVKAWPQSPLRLNTAAKILMRSGYYAEARELVKMSLDLLPRNVETLGIKLEDPGLTHAERLSILKEIATLDPLNDSIQIEIQKLD